MSSEMSKVIGVLSDSMGVEDGVRVVGMRPVYLSEVADCAWYNERIDSDTNTPGVRQGDKRNVVTAMMKEILDKGKERSPEIICNFKADLACKEASIGTRRQCLARTIGRLVLQKTVLALN